MKRTQFSAEHPRSRAYAPAVLTEGGRILWLAGILAPEDEDGKSLAGDFKGQVRCIYRRMAKQLREAGGSLADVVTMTCYITDVRYNLEFVEIRKEFFREELYPASTLVTVQALNRPEALVEITATAVLKED
jgi:2-iminobutanoate/2-iminopropanoate deaminase